MHAQEDHAVAVLDHVTFVGQPADVLEHGDLLVAQRRFGVAFGGRRRVRRGGGSLGNGQEGVDQLGQRHAGSALEHLDDAGDAFGEHHAGVDGARFDPADEQLAGAALEQLEAAALEAAAEFLRHFKQVPAGVFHGVAQQQEEHVRHLRLVVVAGNDDFARLMNGVVGVGAAEVRLDLAAAVERRRFSAFGRGQMGPAAALALLLLPAGDQVLAGLDAHAALVVLERQVVEAFAVQPQQGGLEAVVAGRAEQFAREAADADALEVALRLLQFDLLGPVVGLQGAAAQDVVERFVAAEEQPAVGRCHEQAGRALRRAAEARVEAVALAEHQARSVEHAERVAAAADVVGEHLGGLVLGLDDDVDVLGNFHPFALRPAFVAVVKTARTALLTVAAAARRAVTAVAARTEIAAVATGPATVAARRTAPAVEGVSAAARTALFALRVLVQVAGAAHAGDPGGHHAQVGKVDQTRGLRGGRVGSRRVGFSHDWRISPPVWRTSALSPTEFVGAAAAWQA